MKQIILEYLMTASGYTWAVIFFFFIMVLFLAFELGKLLVWRHVNNQLKGFDRVDKMKGGHHA